VRHHGAGLLRLTRNQGLVDALITEPTSADLSPADMAMVKYAVKLTIRPQSIREEDIRELHKHNFSDRAILEINLIVSYMNFVNRIAQGLGVELESAIYAFRR